MMRRKSVQSIFLLCCIIIASCSKNDAPTPKPVIVSGVQSAKAFAGENRVKLSWRLPSGGDLTKCRIWWNDGNDSITISILSGATSDSVMISSLNEGPYTFQLALLDAGGNISDKTSVSGKVYGESYASGLKNIAVQSTDYDAVNATVNIQWSNAAAGATGIEIKYNDSASVAHDEFVPAYLTQVTLKKFNAIKDSLILYRTLFLPELTAVDTFYTGFDTLKILPAEPGEILWDGNASKGLGVMKQMNFEGDGAVVTIVDDPDYGKAFRFYKPAGAHRSEAHGVNGFQAKDGDDIYIGWASRLTMPQNLSTNAVFQWKSYPTDGSLQNHPIMLRTTSGNLRLRDYLVGDIAHDDWSKTLETGSWHTFVIRIKVSADKNTGFIEFWYDGIKQTLDNGDTRQYCRTFDSNYCDPKWGIYGGDEGEAVNLVAALKIATTYELAKPDKK